MLFYAQDSSCLQPDNQTIPQPDMVLAVFCFRGAYFAGNNQNNPVCHFQSTEAVAEVVCSC